MGKWPNWFPYIDAMMRQLDATGWMHHLGRHAVSCFLTRGRALWQHWELGRDVFDRKLVDADWALNNGNWLWLSGVALLYALFQTIQSPPDGKSSLNVEAKNAEFIRYWVPELKDYIFEVYF